MDETDAQRRSAVGDTVGDGLLCDGHEGGDADAAGDEEHVPAFVAGRDRGDACRCAGPHATSGAAAVAVAFWLVGHAAHSVGQSRGTVGTQSRGTVGTQSRGTVGILRRAVEGYYGYSAGQSRGTVGTS